MCVAVTVATDEPIPTLEQINLMDEANPHGAGIAWLNGNKVNWIKGLAKPKEIHALLSNLPKPLLLHFRLASVGGVHDSLTHPFPISLKAELYHAGEANHVMIHNGHWIGYESAIRALGHKEIPTGKMSDTRLMAFLAARNGQKILKWLGKEGQRIATLNHQGTIVRYGDWDNSNGFYCSNLYWKMSRMTTIGGKSFDWKAYLDERYGEMPAVKGACEIKNSYAEWEDDYVPKSLHRMTEQEIIQAMTEEGGEG